MGRAEARIPILANLGRGVQEPARAKTERPPHALAELVFAVAFKETFLAHYHKRPVALPGAGWK